MTARGFHLSDLLFGVIMPGGGMTLWRGGAGDTGFIGQPDGVIAPAADAFNAASLCIIHIVHGSLVTVRPAANPSLCIVFIEQAELLGTVRFCQPAIVVIVKAHHAFIETTVAAADVSQQPVF
ncbi:hypothetical protein ID853_18965, partial [Xenorhabdus sp. Vera]|uniref:hypothetical protein n=1 Tax=Xenorhabdus koppenhoeferi TaxID=351659 RepID=UPI0019C51047|nr:hypothetical protein [Xenorhabdus sp. Vera]